ncbi:CreA family protein [Pseudorhodobacter sp.]|uniref:CreA family protein n=1 Tax=Pseudorhodobacter sp. TaxID=1934400 RepID=UPI0026495C90|nr:CreA family protein [Pseudorhodobacter sp.]MDN5787186.1 CreA family protein [Pseudorhodobacter sp.]
MIRRPLLTMALTLCAGAALSDEVGKVGVDWLGNDIIVESIADPKVQGVTCHIAYFSRGVIDRLQQGNWFEDPSNSSIDCAQTGPITIGDIDRSDDGEEVFRQSRSIILKSIAVTRIFDEKHQTLIYLAHGREVSKGSAKTSLSTVSLFQTK